MTVPQHCWPLSKSSRVRHESEYSDFVSEFQNSLFISFVSHSPLLEKDTSMTAINEPLNLGDLLKYEEDSLHFSREVATVAAGQELALGTVVGRETVTAKLKQFDPLATDGSENPVGVLLVDVDAILIDVQGALLLNRHAVLASNCVIWPEGITTAAKTAAAEALAALGILIRQSA
jgi:hypothetical protein